MGIFNRGNITHRVAISKTFLNLAQEGPVTVRDIWRGRRAFALDGADSVELEVRPDGVLFLRYEL